MTTSSRTGTYGGKGGVSFDDSHDIDSWGRITTIVVRHGSKVDYVGIGYANGNFSSHGGSGGGEISIEIASDEFITEVSGRSGALLDQLSFQSNKRTIGTFGGSGGTPFSVDFHGGTLHYLFGRFGRVINQIGFGFGALPPMLPSTITRSAAHGRTGGGPFDDFEAQGPRIGKIKAITVRHGAVVDSIAVDYGTGSNSSHGGNGGNPETFSLDDDEWVTEIRGRSGALLDQIQLVLSTGRLSPIYGGNGGQPFSETKVDGIIKAFYGRSGSKVDQVGVYFADAQPISMVITSMTYDESQLNVANLQPKEALVTYLGNDTSVTQEVNQSATIQTSETKSTTVSDTNQVNVKMTFKADFLVAGSQIDVGYTHDETVTTGTSQTDSNSETINFSASVPPYSKIKATAIVKQATYDVPWTASAQVTYQGKQPQTMTLNGVLKGVTTTSVEAQYEPGLVD